MKSFFTLTLAFLSLWGYGGENLYWTVADQNGSSTHHGKPSCHSGKPTLSHNANTDQSNSKGHGMHGGKPEIFTLANTESNATSIRLIRPDLSTEALGFKDGIVTLPKPKTGGFYALIAEENTTQGYQSAIRYISTMGKPSNVSPEKLTALAKTPLEIVPSPLHREHDRYTASKEYRFIVTFNGQPLADTEVILETLSTAPKSFQTDSRGRVIIALPNDFTDVKPERSANKPSEFLLFVSRTEAGKHYNTTFSMPYYVNPNDFWQSQGWGAGAAALGFLGGMILYGRSRKGGKNG